MGIFHRFNAETLRSQLKLTAIRVERKIQYEKSIQSRCTSEIAHCLRQGDDNGVRTKAEHLLHSRLMVKAYEALRPLIDLLVCRHRDIVHHSSIAENFAEPVHSIIYSAPRMDIKELKGVSKQFKLLYGRHVFEQAKANTLRQVNAQLLSSLDSFVTERDVLDLVSDTASLFDIHWTSPSLSPLTRNTTSAESSAGFPQSAAKSPIWHEPRTPVSDVLGASEFVPSPPLGTFWPGR